MMLMKHAATAVAAQPAAIAGMRITRKSNGDKMTNLSKPCICGHMKSLHLNQGAVYKKNTRCFLCPCSKYKMQEAI
jgi:hypothetical protein